jgi:hypothetical protein
MAVLGSELALEIMRSEGDTDYESYHKQMKKLKVKFSELADSQWKENLYWRYLWIFKKLVTHPHKGYPKFMQKKRWQLKELNTALGGWAELRHDVILYGKQSYTLIATAAPTSMELTEGWVEPYPKIYRWLAEFVTTMSVNDFPEEVKTNLSRFAEVLTALAVISEKELADTPLTEKELRLIWNIGSTLRSITKFTPSLMRKITSGADEEMAVIADVHTDPNSKKVLQVGVGYPSEIYLKLSSGKVLKGGVFSYYEFKAPMAERYTDEKWHEELRFKPPKLQSWFRPLVYTER